MSQRNQSLIIPADIVDRNIEHPLLNRLHVTKAGMFTQTRGQYIERKGIPEAIMIYCQAGRGQLKVAGQYFQVVRGDLLVIPADAPHAYGSDPIQPWLIQWLHFRGCSVSYLLLECGLSAGHPIIHLRDERNDQQAAMATRQAETLLTQCRQAIGEEFSMAHQLLAAACLQQLFAGLILYRRHVNESSMTGSADIESMMAYMQDHYAERLTVDQLAARCSLSKFHFIRLFKARTDLTPLAWLNRLRMRRACECLETTNEGIAEISRALGYGNPYYFSAAFKEIIGISPRDYRKLHQQMVQVADDG